MGRSLTTIGFDADDTLWQNEQFFRLTEERFVALLGAHGEAAEISGRLLEAERRNLGFYGFGIKGFVLSMIETAIEITQGEVKARHGDGPERAMMVGNSLKSDILPALEAGAWAAHIPHELTWALEHAEEPAGQPRYRRIPRLSALDELVRLIEAEAAAP